MRLTDTNNDLTESFPVPFLGALRSGVQDCATNNERFSGIGPWLAVGSELPCSVIALLLVGQILGAAFGGPSGATWGAILGSIFGFFLGVYGVYKTIGYLELIERKSQERPRYMPPMEEILEDVTFNQEDDSSE